MIFLKLHTELSNLKELESRLVVSRGELINLQKLHKDVRGSCSTFQIE